MLACLYFDHLIEPHNTNQNKTIHIFQIQNFKPILNSNLLVKCKVDQILNIAEHPYINRIRVGWC